MTCKILIKGANQNLWIHNLSGQPVNTHTHEQTQYRHTKYDLNLIYSFSNFHFDFVSKNYLPTHESLERLTRVTRIVPIETALNVPFFSVKVAKN